MAFFRKSKKSEKRMHDSPGVDWASVWEIVKNAPETFSSCALSAFVAFLRITYEDDRAGRRTTWKHKGIECVLCGMITVSLVSGAAILHIPAGTASFVAGMVGFLGVEKVRSVANSWGWRGPDRRG